MSFILDFFNFLVYLPAFKPDEEDISRNISTLKKYEWFTSYYQDSQISQLIIHNNKVRKKIGQFNTKRLENPKYQDYYQRKLNKIFQKEQGLS